MQCMACVRVMLHAVIVIFFAFLLMNTSYSLITIGNGLQALTLEKDPLHFIHPLHAVIIYNFTYQKYCPFFFLANFLDKYTLLIALNG
jgi:hypothetical protein